MKNNQLLKTSKLLAVIAAAFLIIALFVPIWNIYLDAPQYPEGLVLKIWASKLAGDVDIINGLNHYIGMKTLHAKDFIEFTVLPYILVFFAVIFVLVALFGKKGFLYVAFWAFVIFGVVAMVDFWRWEYDYGHNLDPNAAIKVPGMAYQPPLIGFKQLLNFGAYSIPALGGWLFISAGVLLLIATLKESNFLKKFKKKNIATAAVLLPFVFLLSSCGNQGPEPISLNKEACNFCKMNISDGRFGAEIITKKGRVYKFDDIVCMNGFIEANNKNEIKSYYVSDYNKENFLIDATTAFYVQHESLRSPMAGNVAAFSTEDNADKFAKEKNTTYANWQNVNKFYTNNSSHNEHHEE